MTSLQLMRQEEAAAQQIGAGPAAGIFEEPQRLRPLCARNPGASAPISGRASRPSPGTVAKGPKRRRQRGSRLKLG